MAALTAIPGSYAETVEAMWAYFYGPKAGAPTALGEGNPAGLALERARRWSNVVGAMTAALPLAAFLYLAPDGEDGVRSFLRSDEWQSRRPDPGTFFPHGPGFTAALAGFLGKWAASQECWITELIRTELMLFGPAIEASEAAQAAGLRLAPEIKATTSGLDAPEYLARVSSARQNLPWDVVFAGSRPVARPVGVAVRGDGQQVVLRERSAHFLRWLLPESVASGAFDIEPKEPEPQFVQQIRRLGILADE